MDEEPNKLPEHLQALIDRLAEHARADELEAQVDIDAVLQAAVGMADKMAASRDEKGRYGWHQSHMVHIETLMRFLFEHMTKGDMIDVMNLAMMVWLRQDIDQITDEGLLEGLQRQAEAWVNSVADDRITKMEEIYQSTLKGEIALLQQAQTGQLQLPKPVTVEAVWAANQVINDYLMTTLNHIKASLPATVHLVANSQSLESEAVVRVSLTLTHAGGET